MQCLGRRTRLCFGHLRDMHPLDVFGQGIALAITVPEGMHLEGIRTRELGDLTTNAPNGIS